MLMYNLIEHYNSVQIILKRQEFYSFILKIKQLLVLKILVIKLIIVIVNLSIFPKLLGNTKAQPNPNEANGIFENPTIAVPLKYFWK